MSILTDIVEAKNITIPSFDLDNSDMIANYIIDNCGVKDISIDKVNSVVYVIKHEGISLIKLIIYNSKSGVEIRHCERSIINFTYDINIESPFKLIKFVKSRFKRILTKAIQVNKTFNTTIDELKSFVDKANSENNDNFRNVSLTHLSAAEKISFSDSKYYSLYITIYSHLDEQMDRLIFSISFPDINTFVADIEPENLISEIKKLVDKNNLEEAREIEVIDPDKFNIDKLAAIITELLHYDNVNINKIPDFDCVEFFYHGRKIIEMYLELDYIAVHSTLFKDEVILLKIEAHDITRFIRRRVNHIIKQSLKFLDIFNGLESELYKLLSKNESYYFDTSIKTDQTVYSVYHMEFDRSFDISLMVDKTYNNFKYILKDNRSDITAAFDDKETLLSNVKKIVEDEQLKIRHLLRRSGQIVEAKNVMILPSTKIGDVLTFIQNVIEPHGFTFSANNSNDFNNNYSIFKNDKQLIEVLPGNNSFRFRMSHYFKNNLDWRFSSRKQLQNFIIYELPEILEAIVEGRDMVSSTVTDIMDQLEDEYTAFLGQSMLKITNRDTNADISIEWMFYLSDMECLYTITDNNLGEYTSISVRGEDLLSEIYEIMEPAHDEYEEDEYEEDEDNEPA